jgi:AAA family ATP:ADP antiporter
MLAQSLRRPTQGDPTAADPTDLSRLTDPISTDLPHPTRGTCMTATADDLATRARAWLARLFDVAPHERLPLALAFATFFCVLASYFTVRPLREAMGAGLPKGWLEALFTLVFLAMVALVPVYGWVVSALKRRHVLPAVYAFFIANLLAFAVFLGPDPKAVSPWFASAFFIWVSVYNLFIVSLFWSVMSDRFSSEEGKRLFGIVSAGGTLGAFVAPAMVPVLLTVIDTRHLPLVSALWLAAALGMAWIVSGHREEGAPAAQASASKPPPTLKAVLDGASHVLASPYLGQIAIWVLLANLVSTFFYLEQSRLVAETFKDQADKVRFFAWRDQTVAIATMVIQFVGTAALLSRFGLASGLLALPITCAIGLLWFALVPTLTVVATIMTFERIVAFGLSTPASKVLYTVVTPDEKYKAQNFVDTVVYRGGDAASGWLIRGLGGAGIGGILVVLLPLTGLWVWSSLTLGRMHREREGEPAAPRSINAPAS